MHGTISGTDHDALLTEVQAAKVLNLSTRTLQAWRTKGTGPAFVRAGRAIRYRHCHIFAWVDANTVAAATTAVAAHRQAS